MNMARSSLIITLLSATLAGGFIYFARPISAFVIHIFFAKRVHLGPEIASTSAQSGHVFVRRAFQSEFTSLVDSGLIRHQDRIKVTAGSDLILNFNSGYKIRLKPNSQAVLELYDPTEKNSPALLTVNAGDFELLTSGQAGQLFISKNQQIFSPEAKPVTAKIPILNADYKTKDATSSGDGKIEDQPVVNVEPPLLADSDRPSHATTAPAAKTLPPSEKMNVPNGRETLSSAYIEDVFTEHSEDLRRCQMSSIRDNQDADGQLLLSVTIEPNGRVDSVKVLQNKLKNDQLTNCVQSVIERTMFKPYAGEPITVTYPVEFR
jgi:TonB family protein